MANITVEVKNAKQEFYKLRARFTKLEKFILADALFKASEPMVGAAQSAAPILKSSKRFRQAGALRGRIAPTFYKDKKNPSLISVAIGPTRFRKNEKGFPFYGLFQEKGWWLTSHTPKGARDLVSANRKLGRLERKKKITSLKASRTRIKFIEGTPYLRPAGEHNFQRSLQIFSARVFQRFGEIQDAGVAAGIV